MLGSGFRAQGLGLREESQNSRISGFGMGFGISTICIVLGFGLECGG